VRFVCVSWSLKTVGTELVEYRLGSVGVQEVGWGNGGTQLGFLSLSWVR
jgi:hypothetical protein